MSALLKLRQVLPKRLGDRLGDMDAAFVQTPRAGEPQVAAGMLLELAAACRRAERTRMAYRVWGGRASVRDVDPYRLVHTGRRWYFVALDVERGEWRTFRADRIERLRPTGRAVEFTDPPPDPALLVSRASATGPYALLATVRLPVPMEQALRLIPATVGLHRADGPDVTVVEVGGSNAEGLARYLVGLGTPLRVLAPDSRKYLKFPPQVRTNPLPPLFPRRKLPSWSWSCGISRRSGPSPTPAASPGRRRLSVSRSPR
ncbi:putative DNA-binding transcriptional regulator YafY [Streptomyces tendae]|uniref:helix-turn-helix transcriptional regulator n=1 Tax=Streptomyces tendae TaxID=1932 RepID=UPI003832EDB4